MKRAQFLSVLAMLLAVVLATGVAQAQAPKKITVLTWNLPYYEDGFKKWVADFAKQHPDFAVERLDKKSTEWSTFYQTQVVAGTAPDIIDVQGALWLEYASQGGVLREPLHFTPGK